ncbi:transposase [Pyrenophora seminiperda CCB06]|uniref:Transposase n=1 Tax=Pyrenophora seminiperda CCB06 TaxID=1302712 RepID=A0A3M7MHC9_9PLEO|nr:transposase [Pyrenophora seminiperda CCB06]
MSDLGQPALIEFIPSLAFCVARQRSEQARLLKSPNKNWARAFEKRNLHTQARRVTVPD